MLSWYHMSRGKSATPGGVIAIRGRLFSASTAPHTTQGCQERKAFCFG